MDNIAFIDGQNLYLGTTANDWKIDLVRFRIYLKDKYKISDAYYHLGFIDESKQDLYTSIQKAGFILVFREHSSVMAGTKKGNVDTDIVFLVMKHLIDKSNDFKKILLVSSDGDYKKLVDYLISKERFLKILFPNTKNSSSLYKKLGGEKFDYLDRADIKSLIEYKQRKSP